MSSEPLEMNSLLDTLPEVGPASYPINMFPEPVTLVDPALYPTAVLLLPLSRFKMLSAPIAVL